MVTKISISILEYFFGKEKGLLLWEKCSWFVFITAIFLVIFIIDFAIKYYSVISEYNNYYECIDNYVNKEWVKEKVDDVINNVKLQLSPYIAAWYESEFFKNMKYIESIAYEHPESWSSARMGENLYDYFWWIHTNTSNWIIVGIEYRVDNPKKIKASYEYLIQSLSDIREEYTCQKPYTNRDDSYAAYRKVCDRKLKIGAELDWSICSRDATNYWKYRKAIKEYEKRIQNIKIEN